MEKAETAAPSGGMDYFISKLHQEIRQFELKCQNGEWAAAKNTYDTAVKAALFLELPLEERKRLFESSIIQMAERIYARCGNKDLSQEKAGDCEGG